MSSPDPFRSARRLYGRGGCILTLANHQSSAYCGRVISLSGVRLIVGFVVAGLRLFRCGVEVDVVTVALWIPMAAISWNAMMWMGALLPPPPPSVNVEPSDFPFVVLFVLLAVANHLSGPVVGRLERFWAGRGW